MSKGIALTIGLNAVDPKHYGGWSGKLSACEADAEDMAAIAGERGFTHSSLMTKAATRAKVIDAIVRRMPPDQTPNLFLAGGSDPAFLAQQPFSI